MNPVTLLRPLLPGRESINNILLAVAVTVLPIALTFAA